MTMNMMTLMRAVRVGLLAVSLAILAQVIAPQMSTLHAQVGTCAHWGYADSYLYSDNSYIENSYVSFNGGGTRTMYQGNIDAQNAAITACYLSCDWAPNSIGYCIVNWWDTFNGICQDSCNGPVVQQYGC